MRVYLIIISFLFSGLVAEAQDTVTNQRLTSEVFNKPIPTFKATPGMLPANQATRSYGFFCRQELQMEKRNIPVHLRLGSMDYCNWLESKPGYGVAPPRK